MRSQGLNRPPTNQGRPPFKSNLNLPPSTPISNSQSSSSSTLSSLKSPGQSVYAPSSSTSTKTPAKGSKSLPSTQGSSSSQSVSDRSKPSQLGSGVPTTHSSRSITSRLYGKPKQSEAMEEIASPSSQGSDPNKADANAQHDDEMEQEQVPRREVDKTRAIVVEIRRMKGNQKGPLNKTIKMKIRFDDPTTPDEVVIDDGYGLTRIAPGIRDGDPIRRISLGDKDIWEVDEAEKEAMEAERLARKAGEDAKKGRLTLDAARLLSDVGLPYLRTRFPLIKFAKGDEYCVANLHKLLAGYREWGMKLHPNLHFKRIIRTIEKLGNVRIVKNEVDAMRNAQWEEIQAELDERDGITKEQRKEQLGYYSSDDDNEDNDPTNSVRSNTKGGGKRILADDNDQEAEEPAPLSNATSNNNSSSSASLPSEMQARIEANRKAALERQEARRRQLELAAQRAKEQEEREENESKKVQKEEKEENEIGEVTPTKRRRSEMDNNEDEGDDESKGNAFMQGHDDEGYGDDGNVDQQPSSKRLRLSQDGLRGRGESKSEIMVEATIDIATQTQTEKGEEVKEREEELAKSSIQSQEQDVATDEDANIISASQFIVSATQEDSFVITAEDLAFENATL